MKSKNKAIINDVNRSICMMSDKYDMQSYPTGSTKIKPSEIPAPAKELFLAFLEDHLWAMRTVREGDGETYDPKTELELSYRKGTLDGEDIYWMGMHQPSPFNPSGHDFYVRADGKFVGVAES